LNKSFWGNSDKTSQNNWIVLLFWL
jgi:hypothetical protein